MGDEMVQVPRELVTRILDTSVLFARDATELRACLPWEPPAEQVEALRCAFADEAELSVDREVAKAVLSDLRRQGWELRRREDAT